MMKIKTKITLKNIFYYFQGNLRYRLYYSKHFKWLVRKHIQEQYLYRVNAMREECFNTGSCVVCGCQTTHLQFANKPCEGNCYIKMLNKKDWENIKKRVILDLKPRQVLSTSKGK